MDSKAYLIYIQEDELTPGFLQEQFFTLDEDYKIFVIIQLKEQSFKFIPLIKDLKSIRIEKTLKRIDEWRDMCLTQNHQFILKIIDKPSQLSEFKNDFKGINQLIIHRSKELNGTLEPIIGRLFSDDLVTWEYFQ
ncbi:MAG: hypothetical protein M9897_06875 [Brumimicrobium sp.]|nr:hypothetical protein [Brumimicrobium sp.]